MIYVLCMYIIRENIKYVGFNFLISLQNSCFYYNNINHCVPIILLLSNIRYMHTYILIQGIKSRG